MLEYDSRVRVAAALCSKQKGFVDGEGEAPVILAFNENQEFIGESYLSESQHIGSGSYGERPIFRSQIISSHSFYDS